MGKDFPIALCITHLLAAASRRYVSGLAGFNQLGRIKPAHSFHGDLANL
jgi:hypothetical protein